MKKIFTLIVFYLFLNSCNLFHDDTGNFEDAYKKILIAREIYQDDSLKAKKEIEKIYKEYNFSDESFKDEYYRLTQKNPMKFQEILDSLREEIQREMLHYQKKVKDRE
jgi:hypothetical protein